MTNRPITLADIKAAQRGLMMLSMSVSDLEQLIDEMRGKETFSARVITLGARQMLAAKRRAGAK